MARIKCCTKGVISVMLNDHKYLVLIPSIFAIIICMVQYRICKRCKITIVKLIPAFISLIGGIGCLLLFLYVNSPGVVDQLFYTIVAILLAIIVCSSLVGELIAWVYYILETKFSDM